MVADDADVVDKAEAPAATETANVPMTLRDLATMFYAVAVTRGE